jgi:hypothetical protein
MKPLSTVVAILSVVTMFLPGAASAQQSGSGSAVSTTYRGTFHDMVPDLTQPELDAMAADLARLLRFRQLGDTRTIGRGHVDLGLQFGSAPIDGWTGPRVAGRIGVNNRVDVGVWGGLNTKADYGMFGIDTRILLVTEDAVHPVSVAIRPSVTTLVGRTDVYGASAGIDLTISRTFGAFSPYAGVAATTSAALEDSRDLHLDPGTAEGTLSYAGLAYRWRALVVSAEVERSLTVSYAFRIGTRF